MLWRRTARRGRARRFSRCQFAAQRVVVGLPVACRRARATSAASGAWPSRYSGSPVKKRVGHSSVLFAPGYIGVLSRRAVQVDHIAAVARHEQAGAQLAHEVVQAVQVPVGVLDRQRARHVARSQSAGCRVPTCGRLTSSGVRAALQGEDVDRSWRSAPVRHDDAAGSGLRPNAVGQLARVLERPRPRSRRAGRPPACRGRAGPSARARVHGHAAQRLFGRQAEQRAGHVEHQQQRQRRARSRDCGRSRSRSARRRRAAPATGGSLVSRRK